ncbi:MAG: hypothetical protein ACRD0A_16630 [Acidimicrobiales bacterium]
MTDALDARTGFFTPLVGDGRPLLPVLAGSLVFAGGLMVFLAVTGELLPHDVAYLGLTADELCRVADCRVVDFMVHDRAAFGGTVLGLGMHFAVGYADAWHLLPALAAAARLIFGLALEHPGVLSRSAGRAPADRVTANSTQ